MEVIVIGTFNIQDKDNLEHIVSLNDNIELVWDYDKYQIEASEGIAIMRKIHGLYDVGILLKKRPDNDKTFYSYPLIFELSETCTQENPHSTLWDFFDTLNKSNIERLIIAFADEWHHDTLVRIESCMFNNLKNRLNSVYVWCESYTDLLNNTEVRDSSHPLILNMHR